MKMGPQSRISAIKDCVGVVRELAIILVIAIVIWYPAGVAQWAKSVNEESKKAGAKSTTVKVGPLEMAFENTLDQLSELNAAKNTNEVVRQQAARMVSTASTPSEAKRAKEVLENVTTVGSKLDASISSTKTTLLAQDQVIQDAAGRASGPGTYGIVVSAGKQDDLAAYEVAQLEKQGYSNVAVFDRQRFLRTVARFPDKDSAEKALPNIQGYRKTAYIINLDKWCPNPQASAKNISGVAVLACQ